MVLEDYAESLTVVILRLPNVCSCLQVNKLPLVDEWVGKRVSGQMSEPVSEWVSGGCMVNMDYVYK